MPRKIIGNLEKFTELLVDFLADTSIHGTIRLHQIINKAKNEYNDPNINYFWKCIYTFSRQRTDSFEEFENEIDTFTDPLIRLQAFQRFISQGKWKETSANPRVFINLINSIPGFCRETDRYLHEKIIDDLSIMLVKKIQEFVEDQHRILEDAALSRLAREEQNAKKIKELEKIGLYESEIDAADFAGKNPDKHAFCLRREVSEDKGFKWLLTWHDSNGHAEKLTINKELSFMLERAKNLSFLSGLGSLDQFSEKEQAQILAREFKIKSQCESALIELLDKTNVVLNPDSTLPTAWASTFVVQTLSGRKTIDWYDSLGEKIAISLTDYPDLKDWIVQSKNLQEADIQKLKTLLRYVSTRRKVDENKQENIQKVLQKRHGISLILIDNLDKAPKYKLIPGTYFLTREPSETLGSWMLYQREKGGVNKLINTDDWESFHDILAKWQSTMPQQINNVTKEGLRACIAIAENIAKSGHSSGKNQVNCVAVDQFDSEKASLYPSLIFILSKTDNWELSYIDALHKVLKVNLEDCPQAAVILSKWEGEPSAITTEALTALVEAIGDFRPESRINTKDYAELEKCLSRKPDTDSSIPIVLEGEKGCDEKQYSKLNLMDYGITTVFRHQPKAQPESTIIPLAPPPPSVSSFSIFSPIPLAPPPPALARPVLSMPFIAVEPASIIEDNIRATACSANIQPLITDDFSIPIAPPPPPLVQLTQEAGARESEHQVRSPLSIFKVNRTITADLSKPRASQGLDMDSNVVGNGL